MLVLTAPAEHGLHDGVQLGERGLARHQQPPPDQRADPSSMASKVSRSRASAAASFCSDSFCVVRAVQEHLREK